MNEHKAAAFLRLRRLLEHNRSNIPALIAERAASAFTLHDAPAPDAPTREVSVLVYPQDPFISTPEIRVMNADDIQPGLVNDRIRIHDSRGEPAKPDGDGNYLYWPGSIEFDQINTFYYTTFTLRMYERFARRPLPWSFPAARITVDPHAGNGANAFYSEPERLIGFYSFSANGQVYNAAESADVISHETAHAVLDGLRDLYNECFGLGPTAFHESFGDMTAILVALHDESLVKRLLEWTNGDLHVDNFIATVAEHLTEGSQYAEFVHGHTVYLRNALNKLTNAPFDALPYTPVDPVTELGRESHNYSRLFSGAFYELLAQIFDHLKGEMPELLAIHRARDTAGDLLVCAVELGPVGEFDFSDMAKAFLTADQLLHEGQYADILIRVFDERGILPASDSARHLELLATLPDLRLPESIDTALASALFLEDQVRPTLKLPDDLELTPVAAYRNARGHAFLTYFSHRRIPLVGAQFRQYDGLHADSFGGLTLMFDEEHRLRSVCLRPVTDEDVRQIRILLSELIALGLIADPLSAPDIRSVEPLHLQPGEPRALHVPDAIVALSQLGDVFRTKLVKFPVIFDVIPRRIANFRQYLQAWRERYDS